MPWWRCTTSLAERYLFIYLASDENLLEFQNSVHPPQGVQRVQISVCGYIVEICDSGDIIKISVFGYIVKISVWLHS